MLNEADTRAKVIVLLDLMDQNQMDGWIFIGVSSGNLDGALVEKCLNEELYRRRPEVQEFWLDPCGICGQPGAGAHSHAANA